MRELEIPAEVQKYLDEAPPVVRDFVYFLLDRVKALQRSVEALEARLRAYENLHVPSSKRIIREPKPKKERKPLGAPKGHPGATRSHPNPDRVVSLEPKSCPKKGCGSKRIRVLRERRKVVEDIKTVRVTTEFRYYECECKRCGTRFVTSCEELPKEGNFGPNISSLWAALHYLGTIPFARLAQISESCFDMPVTPKGVRDAIYRVAGVFEPNFRQIWRRVKRAHYVRSDETGYSLNGERWWVWNFSTPRDTLVLIRPSRGSQVLKEVFGEFLDAVMNSDCFKAYDRFRVREYQKCWAHLLRDARDLAKHCEEGVELYRMLQRMYGYIERVKREGRENSPAVRSWISRKKRRFSEWVDRNWGSKAVQNLTLRISKHRDSWFTCLKYGFVEPTNNASERDLRKLVLARKISGAHRSERGAHCREVMMSVVLTCQKRQQNPFEFIRSGIEIHNMDCFLRPP